MPLETVSNPLVELYLREWHSDSAASVGTRSHFRELTAALVLDLGQDLDLDGGERNFVLLGLDDGGLAMIETAMRYLTPLPTAFMGNLPQTVNYVTRELQARSAGVCTVLLLASEVEDAATVLEPFSKLAGVLDAEQYLLSISIRNDALQELSEASLHGRYAAVRR